MEKNRLDSQIKEAAEILGSLQQLSPGFEFSLIFHKNQVYFSRYKSEEWAPSSATIKLVQGLFDQHIDLSFFILRNRIFTTEMIRPAIRNMVKLTAKRISQISVSHSKPVDCSNFIEVGQMDEALFEIKSIQHSIDFEKSPPKIETEDQAFEYCQFLKSKIPRGPVLHDFNRDVIALLVDSENRILFQSVNQASLNKTLHAEVSLVQGYFRKYRTKIPKGSRIYISLKPCSMCASILKEACEDFEGTRFYFFEDDPGPRAKNTELDGQLIRRSNSSSSP